MQISKFFSNFVPAISQKSKNYQINMKKFIIFAAAIACAVSLSAQHVNPITINLTDVNLDSINSRYSGQALLVELARCEDLLKQNQDALKKAEKELKEEQKYYKQMTKMVDAAEKSYKTLMGYTDKELAEYKKLQDVVEKQIKEVNNANLIDSQTRINTTDELNDQRRQISAAINSTSDRNQRLSKQNEEFVKLRDKLVTFYNELINKESNLKQLAIQLKSRQDLIKAEKQRVKSLK